MKGHHSPKKTKKPRLPLYRLYYAVVLLLVAVSGTSMWTTTTLAKYGTSSSGSDKARVARFAVSAEGADKAIELDAGNTEKNKADYQFTVSNKIGDKVNETATGYDVVVTFPSELKGVTLTLRNGNNTFSAKPSTDNTSYTFENVGGEWDNIKIEVRAAQKN